MTSNATSSRSASTTAASISTTCSRSRRRSGSRRARSSSTSSTSRTRERARRSLERRLSRSRLGPFKPMADFEWEWPTKIARAEVEAALELDFLERERNLVLVAAEGLGKTMIARNIIHNAILAGRSALFISAAELLLDLGGQDSARGLDRRLKHYARIGLLAIDEIGYLSYDVRNADLLFQLVSMRYEKKPLVLTTNLAFSDWPKIFPGAACTTALIDRVVHHADIIPIEGKSYRLRDATQDQAEQKRSRRKKT
ncbi:MAG: ATP-binding protein [Sandaracinaceae bacterium]|nr:ATP-binding protein [Sandaracinaceae bacterium]